MHPPLSLVSPTRAAQAPCGAGPLFPRCTAIHSLALSMYRLYISIFFTHSLSPWLPCGPAGRRACSRIRHGRPCDARAARVSKGRCGPSQQGTLRSESARDAAVRVSKGRCGTSQQGTLRSESARDAAVRVSKGRCGPSQQGTLRSESAGPQDARLVSRWPWQGYKAARDSNAAGYKAARDSNLAAISPPVIQISRL
jgi:hypothetical protein